MFIPDKYVQSSRDYQGSIVGVTQTNNDYILSEAGYLVAALFNQDSHNNNGTDELIGAKGALVKFRPEDFGIYIANTLATVQGACVQVVALNDNKKAISVLFR